MSKHLSRPIKRWVKVLRIFISWCTEMSLKNIMSFILQCLKIEGSIIIMLHKKDFYLHFDSEFSIEKLSPTIVVV